MRFFTDDGVRRTSTLWTWRSTTVVLVLALVSSLAVGLGAAGGLSVLDEPTGYRSAVPPLADTRPPVPLPLDPDSPPPPPNTADVSEPEPPRDTAPQAEAEPPGTVDVPLPEAAEAETVPEVDDQVDDTADETVEGTWTAVDDTVTGTWVAVEGTFETVTSTRLPGWPERHCPETDGSESGWYPSWDTGYSDRGGYER